MSYKFANQFRHITGLGGHAKSVLLLLADLANDSTHYVKLSMANLLIYADVSLSTGKRALRRLEDLGYILPQSEKGGRGHFLEYVVSDVPLQKSSPVESVPVKPPEELPPTNGHNGYKPPALPDRKDGLTAYRDPLARRADETAMEYARRVDRR